MATQKKGNYVIMNAPGVVAFAGRATFVNSTPSAGASDVSPVQEHEDSVGVVRTITRNKTAYEMTLTLTPGIGGTGATIAGATNFATAGALATAADLIKIGSQIITTEFPVASLNWPDAYKARITSSSISASGNGAYSMSVTARRECSIAVDGVTEVPIDFTGAWQNL